MFSIAGEMIDNLRDKLPEHGVLAQMWTCGDCEHTFVTLRPVPSEDGPPSETEAPRCPFTKTEGCCAGGCYPEKDYELVLDAVLNNVHEFITYRR